MWDRSLSFDGEGEAEEKMFKNPMTTAVVIDRKIVDVRRRGGPHVKCSVFGTR
jgi:hypothetical protein